MRILITICARGGSKGIPGKNVKMINGKPLIAYSIATAQKFATMYDVDIELSTDSLEIRKVAASHGLKSDYSARKIIIFYQQTVLRYHVRSWYCPQSIWHAFFGDLLSR